MLPGCCKQLSLAFWHFIYFPLKAMYFVLFENFSVVRLIQDFSGVGEPQLMVCTLCL